MTLLHGVLWRLVPVVRFDSMSERSTRKGDRFRWWISDRSGLQFGFVPLTDYPNDYTRESGRPVRDNGIQVAPDEYDQPPLSKKPLGGEGEIGTRSEERRV